MTSTQQLIPDSQLVYYLRAFPPIEEKKKLVFNDPDDLCIYLKRLHEQHLINNPELSTPLDQFVENYIHVTCIDKSKCSKHKKLFG